jgi:predicted RNase H-like HicB family nuclease
MKATHKQQGLTLRINICKGHDGKFVAECLDIPGCMSQGVDEAEAQRNLSDAIKACLGVMLEDFVKRNRKSTSETCEGKQQEFRVASPELELVEA